MPARPPTPCTTPGCPRRSDRGGRCERCRAGRAADTDRRRGSASARGYDRHWACRRRDYLLRNPACDLCGRLAETPDHWPRSRRQLILAGVADPDADEHLRPLCDNCHRRETARNQPGGWNRR